jgi:hypothetical protein
MSYTYFGDLEEHYSKFNTAPSNQPAVAQPSTPAESTPVSTHPSSTSSAPPALVDEYESNEHYDKAGSYMISTLCLGSYPCKHSVIDLTKGEKLYLNGVAIYERLQSQGVSHSHFDVYKDYAKIEL